MKVQRDISVCGEMKICFEIVFAKLFDIFLYKFLSMRVCLCLPNELSIDCQIKNHNGAGRGSWVS